MTAISNEEDVTLLKKWQSTDVWPIVKEHAASISGSNWKSKHYTNFCPEVSYDKFKLFASMLCTFIDEIDRDSIGKWLIENERAWAKDWRWDWAHVDPLHYSQCVLYSQLPVINSADQALQRPKDDILSLKPGMFGISKEIAVPHFEMVALTRHE